MRWRQLEGGRYRMRPKLVTAVLAVSTVVGSVVAGAAPAHASFPGPDGRIAFIGVRTGNQAIFTMKPDGSDVQQLSHFGKHFQTALPSWSADGRFLVFQAGRDRRDRDIWMMDADGTDAHRVFADPWLFDAVPGFSPDGRTVIFTRCGEEGCSLWTIGTDGKDLTQLTPGGHDVTDFTARYSPDGSRIAFESFGRGGVIAAVYVMDADGSHMRRLTPARLSARGPDWSPDGSKITFWTHCCDPKNAEVWVMNSDGTGPTRLTHPYPDHDTFTVFSPLGDRIAIERDSPDFSTGSVYVMNPDGTGLTDIQDDAFQPSWGPNP
jgi:Tol biopolymer transport system component